MTDESAPAASPIPHLKNLIAHTENAYEATFLVVNAPNFDSRTEAELIYNAQSVLNLLQYAMQHPEKIDLSHNFGEMTLDALDHLTRRVKGDLPA